MKYQDRPELRVDLYLRALYWLMSEQIRKARYNHYKYDCTYNVRNFQNRQKGHCIPNRAQMPRHSGSPACIPLIMQAHQWHLCWIMFPKGSTSALEHAVCLGDPSGASGLLYQPISNISCMHLFLGVSWLVLCLNVLSGIECWLKDFPSEGMQVQCPLFN